MDKTSLGNRMKDNYESRSRIKLVRRTPVILRLDGVAFHTYTRGFVKPFDYILMYLMEETTRKLCEKIQGAVFAYQQSDEISILLKDYSKLTSEAWFDYNIQKVCSVAASMATKIFADEVSYVFEFWKAWQSEESLVKFGVPEELCKTHAEAFLGTTYRYGREAFFDCRAFNVPKEEVVNYFVWRQQDATRNSIQMVGQSQFSQKQLHQKSCDDIQEMLFSQKGINWNDFPVPQKRGISVYRRCDAERNPFEVDRDIPIFTQDRNHIDRFINPEEE